MTAETRVGLFAIAGLFLTGLAVFMLGDVSLRKEYPIYIEFKDVAGLPDKSIVKLSGVEIGKVREIILEGDRVIVCLAVRDGVKIYRDARFQIGSTSIIGSKFLQIDQGTPSAGLLAAGARVRGEDSMPLDRMLNKTMSSLQSLLQDIGQDGRFGKELNSTMVNVRELTAKLNDLVASLEPSMKGSMENVEAMTKRMDQLIAKVDALMDKINSGEGTVGALITDKKMKEDMKETVSNAKDVTAQAKNVLNRVGGFRVYWSYDSRYEPQARMTRSDFGVKISPREGRYYYLGIANMANTGDQSYGPDYVEKNKINARLGWETDNMDFYAGLIHGAGGIGIKYKPFAAAPLLKRVSVNAEASDFLRNRTINGRKFDHPDYDLGAEVRLHRMVAVGVRMSDIQGTGAMQYTANITFEDKDIAYLLGLVSLGTMKSTGK